MAQDDVFYSVTFTNTEADGGQPHFAIIKLDPSDKLARHLRMMEGNNPALKYDDNSVKKFPTRHEAQAYNEKLATDATAANPDRIDANQQFPGEPNRILSAGSPAIAAG